MRDFRKHGEKAVAQVRRQQPAAYLKILALLIPREHKIEHNNPIKNLSDEQLEAMIEYIETSLAAQAGGVKVIESTIEAAAVDAMTPPVLESPKCKSNRLMIAADTAVGPRERKPRKVPSPASTLHHNAGCGIRRVGSTDRQDLVTCWIARYAAGP